MKENITRMVIEINKSFLHELKQRALNNRMSLKNWVLLALTKAIYEEDNK